MILRDGVIITQDFRAAAQQAGAVAQSREMARHDGLNGLLEEISRQLQALN